VKKSKVNRAALPGTVGNFDRCQTPAEALLPILPWVWGRKVWEPAAGDGIMAAELAKVATVTTTDLLTGNDFLKPWSDPWKSPEFDVIVTNPPFSLKYKFLARCYEYKIPFALLMQVDVFGAKTAQRLFEKNGAQVILLDRRINFKMPNLGWAGGGSHFAVAWFTWGLGLPNELNYYWMPPPACPYCQSELIRERRETGDYCEKCGGKVGQPPKKKVAK